MDGCVSVQLVLMYYHWVGVRVGLEVGGFGGGKKRGRGEEKGGVRGDIKPRFKPIQSAKIGDISTSSSRMKFSSVFRPSFFTSHFSEKKEKELKD